MTPCFDITVVIPMYNAIDTIRAAIASVVSQTYTGVIEIIVINDGSTDGCEKIVEEIISNNKTSRKIRLINKENGGVSSARNRGVYEASSEWIALLDSDDEWLPEKLEKQVSVIVENPDVSFLGTNASDQVYPFFGKSKKRVFTLNAHQLMIKWYPYTPTILAKKKLFVDAGLFDELKRHGEDCDLWLRCLAYAEIYILNESLVEIGHGKHPFGEKGLSADLTKMFLGELRTIKDSFKRSQIGLLYMLFCYSWLSLKFVRRYIYVMAKLN